MRIHFYYHICDVSYVMACKEYCVSVVQNAVWFVIHT